MNMQREASTRTLVNAPGSDATIASKDSSRYTLVTGGAGYIGSHTVLELLTAGFKVVVVDNLSNSCVESLRRVKSLAPAESSLKFIQADITDAKKLKKIFKKYDFESVIHFAGLKSVSESISNPLEYYQTNFSGTVSLLDAMKEADCLNLVFSSSATVYGNGNGNKPLVEETPTGPINPYGQTKLMAEQLILDFVESHPNMNAAILRYFNPIGSHPSGLIGENPLNPPNNLVPCVTRAMVDSTKALQVFGDDYNTQDGTAVRDYIHVVDLAQGHLAALNKLVRDAPGSLIMNMGNGRGYTVKEVIQEMERVSGVKVPHSMAPRRAGDSECVIADPTLSIKTLNWAPSRNLTQMCESAWKWKSSNPKGYVTESKSKKLEAASNRSVMRFFRKRTVA